MAGPGAEKVKVRVCVGTGCYLRGSQDLLHGLIRRIGELGLSDRVDVQATFCFEQCDRGPSVAVGDQVLERCSLDTVQEALVSLVT
ncbi:MAG TPA: (2Fe-2S) ferredoxin domain-containing protein [Armatimonadota bacterium]|nr:(2Fe-2S) ferredoxin domain-containing protein [Armatimonadota bacterium]